MALSSPADVFFYNVSHRIGIERIHDMAVRLGFGAKLGIDLPRENPGSDAEHRLEEEGAARQVVSRRDGSRRDRTGLCVGNPPATGGDGGATGVGSRSGPRIARPDGSDREAFKSLGLNPPHLAAVQKGMIGVTNEPGGTAFWTRILEKEFAMAGKTGTSQVRRITRAERARGVIRNKDLPWEKRTTRSLSPSPRWATPGTQRRWSSSTAAAARGLRRRL